ncbi:hypothetical protein C8Q75DRAFT_799201 [Abortiporus biennis]|nr:hypothetical protein C8Q75DRAFT_799201 [Abortiporus biennis]
MQSTNFETFIWPNGTIDACYFNTSLNVPCTQGSVPIIGVNAQTPSDVQAAVKFASAHNLRLIVKNTGHDYLGRSTAKGSFLIWIHNMKNITFHETFVPTGAPPTEVYNKTLTLGAGVQWYEAYDAAHSHNVVIVGGLSAGGSVGSSGGWFQGGGHSALSPSFGLGVDNVLELTVVTSTGEHLTANSHIHSDLFWALRGGGGGTYGIVTSVTYRTHPSTPITATFLSTTIISNVTGPSPILTKLFTELVRVTPNLSDSGWGGYTLFYPGTPGTSLALQILYITPNLNVSNSVANSSIQSFYDYAQQLATNSSMETGDLLNITAAVIIELDSFYAWETQYFRSSGQVGGNIELGSRLLPRNVIENDYEKVAKMLLPLPGLNYYLVAGGAVSRVNSSSTGLNPAWRKALVHTVFGGTWQEGASAQEIMQVGNTIKAGIANLHALAPDSGAYFNEASKFEPDPLNTFFGSHYKALKDIKLKYDPYELFIVSKGVGSEDWDEDLNCKV